MSLIKIQVNTANQKYPIYIGNNILNKLNKFLKNTSINLNNCLVVADKNVPKKLIKKVLKSLPRYSTIIHYFNASEKNKNLNSVQKILSILLKKNFNRNDCLISIGGGITGDVSGFAASIYKRGLKFINIPTTLLSQVDSSIGGKTGVNTPYGKNLIGSFYQPKLVISDVEILKSLPQRELVCGYAEILKHALILKGNFFYWLKNNSNKLLKKRNLDVLKDAIVESCKIKLHFVNKDIFEKNIRMTLNFGHTFAHAIEAQNKYSKKINHGEAVIMGMMMAARLSYLKKICNLNTLNELKNIYNSNGLKYDIKKIFKKSEYAQLTDFMSIDKKNNDKKINLILLKKIGQTTTPNKYKISSAELKKVFNKII